MNRSPEDPKGGPMAGQRMIFSVPRFVCQEKLTTLMPHAPSVGSHAATRNI
jgi:hypothetical protein